MGSPVAATRLTPPRATVRQAAGQDFFSPRPCIRGEGSGVRGWDLGTIRGKPPRPRVQGQGEQSAAPPVQVLGASTQAKQPRATDGGGGAAPAGQEAPRWIFSQAPSSM